MPTYPQYQDKRLREPFPQISFGFDMQGGVLRPIAVDPNGRLFQGGTVAATATLTSDATNTDTGGTLDLGDQRYRLMTTPAQAYDIQIGGTAAITLDNIKAAVNGTGTAGVEYFLGTLPHPFIEATTNTDTTQVFAARQAGAGGNSITVSENATHLTFSGATTLSGGSDNTSIGDTKVISVTPTVDATPDYADGDVLGGLQSITNAARQYGGSGVLSSISVSCKVALAIGLRFLFFKSNPSSTTFTENSALTINAADYDKLLGKVDTETSDVVDLGTPDLVTKLSINLPYVCGGGTTLYAVCLARGALNLGSASDLTFNYGVLRD